MTKILCVIFAGVGVVGVSTQVARSQNALQSQSEQDFNRLLSPGTAKRVLTAEKLDRLKAEASKDCFSPDSFQRAVPPLDPNQRRPLPCAPKNPFDRFVMWNQIALDTTAIDHAPPPPGEKANSALQHLGPHRSSRAMAIVHIAMFDAINIATRYNQRDPSKPTYTFATYSNNIPEIKHLVSLDTVVTYAAGAALKALYKEQADVIDDFVAKDEVSILAGKDRNDPFYREARDLGRAAAKAILDARKDDGSAHEEPEVGKDGFPFAIEPGKWRPDPVSNVITALGGKWGSVKPFVIPKDNVKLFRPPPPPALQDARYTHDFDEVKRLGGDGNARSGKSERSQEQEEIGIFWAYDGTAFLCAPPRLYNQIIRQIVQQKTKEMTDKGEDPVLLNYARIFAMSNIAMADAAITAWDAKYHYNFWRPVVGIRAAQTDGNGSTEADLYWRALGAPASNSARGPNFTPPFPAYPSGHATFGGALFDVLRNFFPEDTKFDFMSDEYNGINEPAGSDTPRAKITRHFDNFRAAEDENARSRIYLGVHWQFDADAGVAQGNQVGSFVAGNILRCLTKEGDPIDCKPTSSPDVVSKFLLATEKRVLITPKPAPTQ